jgi:hypothetical protein
LASEKSSAKSFVMVNAMPLSSPKNPDAPAGAGTMAGAPTVFPPNRPDSEVVDVSSLPGQGPAASIQVKKITAAKTATAAPKRDFCPVGSLDASPGNNRPFEIGDVAE